MDIYLRRRSQGDIPCYNKRLLVLPFDSLVFLLLVMDLLLVKEEGVGDEGELSIKFSMFRSFDDA